MYNPGALLMPSWRHYGWALYMFQMSWHCAPLKSEGAFSLSGNPMRGKPQSVSNQKGSSSCLQSENCWSQSPICWPMVTVSNLSTRTNNRWLAYQPVIIARWYITQCHAMITTSYQISSTSSTFPSQFFSISQCHSHLFNSFPQPNLSTTSNSSSHSHSILNSLKSTVIIHYPYICHTIQELPPQLTRII